MQNKRKIILLIVGISLLIILTGVVALFVINNNLNGGTPKATPTITLSPTKIKPTLNQSINLPYYFIAVHNEPYTDEDNQEAKVAEAYTILKRMVAKADEYDIKLTLMFTPQWADYINKDPIKLAEIETWAANGHEIGGHHHSEYHGGSWDGYTPLTPTETLEIRRSRTRTIEPTLGTMEDYITKLQLINPNIDSGCMNDEQDKRVMPDEIIYDSCSGFTNSGTLGTRRADGADELVGINDYIVTGKVNNIQRFWISHYIIANNEKAQAVVTQMQDMELTSVYGAIVHSNALQEQALYTLMGLIHKADANGVKSVTLKQVIVDEMLPIQEIDDSLINTLYSTGSSKPSVIPPKGSCGDNVCSDVEKNFPALCPEDCG